MSTPRHLRATLALSAIVLLVLGSGLTFAPHLMATLYGTPETVDGANAGRTAGAAIFALGVLAWIGTRQELKILRSVVVPVLFVWFVLKTMVAYLGLVYGVFRPPVGRTVFVLDLALAAVYGYFLFVIRGAVTKPNSG